MSTPTYKALATITLGTNTASVTFSSIPATYRDLRLVVAGNTTELANILCVLNGDSSSIYTRVAMAGRAASATPNSATTTSASGHLNSQTATTSSQRTFGTIDFMDYSATDKHKTFLSRTNTQEGDATFSGVEAIASRYASSSALTQIQVLPGAGSLSTGTTLNLYGIAS
jgi:hypothetical protein